MASAWICPQCGTANAMDATECSSCGRWPSVFDLERTVELDTAGVAVQDVEDEPAGPADAADEVWQPVEAPQPAPAPQSAPVPEPTAGDGRRQTATDTVRTVLDSIGGKPDMGEPWGGGDGSQTEEKKSGVRGWWIWVAFFVLFVVVRNLVEVLT